MQKLDLSGKVSVITGAARGIGESTAEIFIQHGSDVAIIDIDKKRGKEISSKLKKKYKEECGFFNCDVCKYNEVKDTCQKILYKFGKVDNLICCAGYSSVATLDNMKIEEWEKSIAVNLNGTFYFIRSLVNSVLEEKRGNIIIIGSSTKINGSGGGVHYAASKAGLYGIVKGVSYELLTRGIRINIITPAVIDTPMLRKRYPNTEEVNKKLAAQIPLGRIGRPSDIANIALFLASDISEYICGQEIIADGGRILYRHPTGS